MKTIIDGEKCYVLKKEQLCTMLKKSFDNGFQEGSMAAQNAIYASKNEQKDEEELLVFGSN